MQDIPRIGGSPVRPSPCQPHLRQRQLTQQRLFSWLPRTLAFKGQKKKKNKKNSVFPRQPYSLLTPELLRPPPHSGQRGWGPGACERAHRHAPGRPASPRELCSSDWLGLEQPGIQKFEFLPELNAASCEQSCQCERSLGRGCLVLPG